MLSSDRKHNLVPAQRNRKKVIYLCARASDDASVRPRKRISLCKDERIIFISSYQASQLDSSRYCFLMISHSALLRRLPPPPTTTAAGALHFVFLQIFFLIARCGRMDSISQDDVATARKSCALIWFSRNHTK